MKFGVDTFGCDHGRAGTGTYLASIMPHLLKAEDTQWFLYGSELDRYTYSESSEAEFEAIELPQSISAERIWHYFSEQKFIADKECNAILYPAAARVAPLFSRVPGVFVVNDIASVYFASQVDVVAKFIIKYSLKHADAIIVPSAYVRDDLVRLGVKKDKISVIYHGINHSEFYRRDMMDSDIVNIKPFAIKRPYIIYASSMRSLEKKHIELIRAFEKFKAKTKLPHKLVLCGSDGAATEAIHQTILHSDFASDILMTGYFPHEGLPELFAAAEAFVFPSACDGVGLPVLEAMATGIPVACASRCALPEITGNNALFFDPDDTDEMAASIEKLLTDNALREKLISSGVEWAQKFTWEDTAAQTLKILKSVAKSTK